MVTAVQAVLKPLDPCLWTVDRGVQSVPHRPRTAATGPVRPKPVLHSPHPAGPGPVDLLTRMHDDQFLTTEEVMDYLQVNLRTVYRLIKAGRIPAIRIGRQWRFQRRDIDAWLEANRSSGRRRTIEPRQGARRRVLVVDDEQIVRDLLMVTLSSADYDVEAAGDGADAIGRLQVQPYDLLITDVRMPGVDGLSVVREARQRSKTMAIVIITGASSEAIAIEAINLGVNGYLTKPFGVDRVLAVTARALDAAAALPTGT